MSKKFLVQVAILLIGIVLGGILQPFNSRPSAAQGDCRAFPETGKQVCGRFLQYWTGAGGLAQQGLPISNEFVEVSDLNGKSYTVQYFERAVFEKHPENAAPYDILLSQLGTFQFARKYPNGEPGAPPPTAIPVPTTLPAGPKLEIIDQQVRKRSFGGSEVIGYIKNTGSGDLGGIQIIATFKDAGGKIVGTGSTSGTLLRPDDIYPFAIGNSTEFVGASLQLSFRVATASDKAREYRDFTAEEVNVVPPANTYSHAKIAGSIKNTGTKTAYLTHINVLITDGGGKTVDVGFTYATLEEIAPGQSSPFEVSLDVDEVVNYQVVVDSSVK